MTNDEVMTALQAAIADEIGAEVTVTRESTALEVEGWDSLAHTRIIMNLEARLGVEIDMDRTYRLATVGELIDLVLSSQETENANR